jgi:hypothetical protein
MGGRSESNEGNALSSIGYVHQWLKDLTCRIVELIDNQDTSGASHLPARQPRAMEKHLPSSHRERIVGGVGSLQQSIPIVAEDLPDLGPS